LWVNAGKLSGAGMWTGVGLAVVATAIGLVLLLI